MPVLDAGIQYHLYMQVPLPSLDAVTKCHLYAGAHYHLYMSLPSASRIFLGFCFSSLTIFSETHPKRRSLQWSLLTGAPITSEFTEGITDMNTDDIAAFASSLLLRLAAAWETRFQ